MSKLDRLLKQISIVCIILATIGGAVLLILKLGGG